MKYVAVYREGVTGYGEALGSLFADSADIQTRAHIEARQAEIKRQLEERLAFLRALGVFEGIDVVEQNEWLGILHVTGDAEAILRLKQVIERNRFGYVDAAREPPSPPLPHEKPITYPEYDPF